MSQKVPPTQMSYDLILLEKTSDGDFISSGSRVRRSTDQNFWRARGPDPENFPKMTWIGEVKISWDHVGQLLSVFLLISSNWLKVFTCLFVFYVVNSPQTVWRLDDSWNWSKPAVTYFSRYFSSSNNKTHNLFQMFYSKRNLSKNVIWKVSFSSKLNFQVLFYLIIGILSHGRNFDSKFALTMKILLFAPKFIFRREISNEIS